MDRVLRLKKQNEDGMLPTKRDFYTELSRRGVLSKEQTDELDQLNSGIDGEQILQDYLEEFGEPHWIVFKNVWLNYYGKFEIDCILVTRSQIYLFEVKNYKGHYVFQNSQCRCNGQKIGQNAITQAQKSSINFTNCMRKNRLTVPVTGVLLFSGIDCEVTLHDEIDDLQIVTRNQLRNFIWKIKHIDRNYSSNRVDVDEVIHIMECYEAHNPFLPESISDNLVYRIQKGIRCSHCQSFEVDASKMYISCKCGMHEPRENAIVRTICEYGMIHFDKDLLLVNLVDFFNGNYSRNTILKYLHKHFTQTTYGRHIKFANAFKRKDFTFKRPRYFKC